MKSDLPERSFEFAKRIVRLCQYLEKKRGVSQILTMQLFKAGTSVGANIEEGQASQSKADFISKYSISCKECRETNYWLRLILETKIVSPVRIKDLINESNELIAILTTIIKKLKAKQK
jgi:four helix bundle protein